MYLSFNVISKTLRARVFEQGVRIQRPGFQTIERLGIRFEKVLAEGMRKVQFAPESFLFQCRRGE